MNNLEVCFDFMKKEENLKLVNIGPTDLRDSNKKLALGLVWTLILTYQIGGTSSSLSSAATTSASTTSTTGSSSSPASASTSSSTAGDSSRRRSTELSETSAKRMLLDWCAERAGEPVANFETSFCDGRVFAKLLNSIDKTCALAATSMRALTRSHADAST